MHQIADFKDEIVKISTGLGHPSSNFQVKTFLHPTITSLL